MKLQKARKDHKCDICGKKIPKGAMYWRHYSQDDLSATPNSKEHRNCLDYENKSDDWK